MESQHSVGNSGLNDNQLLHFVQEIALIYYGLAPTNLTVLDGFVNIGFSVAPKKFVAKLYFNLTSEDIEQIQAETAILQYLKQASKKNENEHLCQYPEILKTHDNKKILHFCLEELAQRSIFIESPFNEISIRILTFVEGTLLSHHHGNQVYSEEVLTKYIKQVAQLDKILLGFNHPVALKRKHDYHMVELCRQLVSKQTEDEILSEKLQILDEKTRQLVTQQSSLFLATLDQITHKYQQSPPRQSVIHNDLNRSNVVTTQNSDGNIQVSGIFDFGDYAYTYTIIEPAISAIHLCLDIKACEFKSEEKYIEKILNILESVLKIFAFEFKANQAEIQLFFACTIGRLIALTVNGFYYYEQDIRNQYFKESADQAMKLLEVLKGYEDKKGKILFEINSDF